MPSIIYYGCFSAFSIFGAEASSIDMRAADEPIKINDPLISSLESFFE